MLPLKLGHKLGCLAFSEKKCGKKNNRPPTQITFENTMGRNAQQIYLKSNYIALYQKTVFGFDPGPG